MVIDATMNKWRDVVPNMLGQTNEGTGLSASTHPDHKLIRKDKSSWSNTPCIGDQVKYYGSERVNGPRCDLKPPADKSGPSSIFSPARIFVSDAAFLFMRPKHTFIIPLKNMSPFR